MLQVVDNWHDQGHDNETIIWIEQGLHVQNLLTFLDPFFVILENVEQILRTWTWKEP